MKKLMYIATTCGIVILAGCTSLDDRLASNDPHVRSAAEHELVQRSRTTGTEADRIAAIKRITDKNYLYEIALHASTNHWIADDASFDPRGYDGCVSAGPDRVYYKLTRHGQSYTTVHGKRLNTTKEGVAAVGQLKFDDSKKEEFIKLFELVRKAESDQVKLAAFKAAKDPKRSQTLASALARATKDASVQSEALAKMDPEKRLAAIAQNSSNANERLDAFSKLKDQKAIDEIVLKTNDRAILLAGMSKVSDKAALASRVFSKDFAEGTDTELVLGWLKTISSNRIGNSEKPTANGNQQTIETALARTYREKSSELSEEDKGLLISMITNPEVIANMVIPPIIDEEEVKIRRNAIWLDLRAKTMRKILPMVIESEKKCVANDWNKRYGWFSHDGMRWIESQIPDLSNKQKNWISEWQVQGLKKESFENKLKWMDADLEKCRKELKQIQASKPESFYVKDTAARKMIFDKVSPDIMDKVFPFKGILVIYARRVEKVRIVENGETRRD